MFETNVNLIGQVATDVKFFPPNRPEGGSEGVPFAKFRVASTSRKFNKKTDTWEAGDTLFVTIACFRRLAEHVASSLNKGDPVIVYGKLRIRQWESPEKGAMTDLEITAIAVGHNLMFGTSAFYKSLYRTQSGSGVEEPFAQPVGGQSNDADSPVRLAEVSALPGAHQVTDIRSVGAPVNVSGAQPPHPGEEGNSPRPDPSHTSPAADEQAA